MASTSKKPAMMRRVLVIALMLFCLAVLISQLRTPKLEGLSSGTAAVRSISGAPSPDDAQSPSHQAGSSIKAFPRPRAISLSTVAENANAAPTAIQVEWHGHWYAATVVQVDGNRRLIHYTGYGDESNEWVGPERMREVADQPTETPIDPRQDRLPAAGDFVVHWGERWWRAEVLDRKGDQTLIRYIGYGPEWDEWVTPERAKTFTEADALAQTQKSLVTEEFIAPVEIVASVAPSAPFQVEWNGQWYPAKVLREENGRFFIHYEGYGDNWDEWVPVERLRTAKPKLN